MLSCCVGMLCGHAGCVSVLTLAVPRQHDRGVWHAVYTLHNGLSGDGAMCIAKYSARGVQFGTAREHTTLLFSFVAAGDVASPGVTTVV